MNIIISHGNDSYHQLASVFHHFSDGILLPSTELTDQEAIDIPLPSLLEAWPLTSVDIDGFSKENEI